MNNKFVLVVVGLLVLAGALWFVQDKQKTPSPKEIDLITGISADKKYIVVNNKSVLSIDNQTIFDFFRNESQLCDGANISSTPDRKLFCEDKTTFTSKSRFKSVVASADNKKIGFTIETDTLTPDTVVGIFNLNTGKVSLLTNYYLGNEFISFSPNDKNFVYAGGCWEGNCAFYIKDSETLADKIDFIPTIAEERGDYRFVKWVSDNEIVYTLDGEVKTHKF